MPSNNGYASKDGITFKVSFYVTTKHMGAMQSPNVKTMGYYHVDA